VLLLHLPHLAHGDRRSIVTPSSYFRRALGEDIGDTDSEDTGSGGNDSGQCNPDCSDNSDVSYLYTLLDIVYCVVFVN